MCSKSAGSDVGGMKKYLSKDELTLLSPDTHCNFVSQLWCDCPSHYSIYNSSLSLSQLQNAKSSFGLASAWQSSASGN